MPRANRYFTPGYIWHVTHRCHDRAFLLKFSCDRDAYKTLLYEVRRRYGLCVLNYMITNNHIHMLVADTGDDRISKSMQFVAGQIAQDYNRRRGRSGSFWEDRYHATAVDTQEYLWRINGCTLILIWLGLAQLLILHSGNIAVIMSSLTRSPGTE